MPVISTRLLLPSTTCLIFMTLQNLQIAVLHFSPPSLYLSVGPLVCKDLQCHTEGRTSQAMESVDKNFSFSIIRFLLPRNKLPQT